jgi:hypothetical protein
MCVDLTTDDTRCGACTNASCAKSDGIERKCRTSQCLLVDGYVCKTDSECYNGKCTLFYADRDGDGYPNKSETIKFCSIAGNDKLINGGAASPNYIPPRLDGKWDCCDAAGLVHPGATTSYDWSSSGGSDPKTLCAGPVGDTNCDNTAAVEPTWANAVVTGCSLDSAGTCQPTTKALSSKDCGASFNGCNCNDSCDALQCFTSIAIPCL